MTAPAAAVLLTGNELLRGVIADRNASFLAADLERRGLRMRRTVLVGDELADVEEAIGELAAEVDLLVTSGGLGPTHDDRTVEALARAAGSTLELDEAVLAQIDAWTGTMARRYFRDPASYAAGNRKQAHVPRGAQVLGLAGTAPGLVMPVGKAVAVVLPGVPSELRRLWSLAPAHPLVAPLVARAEPRERFVLRTYEVPESHVADLFAAAGGDPPGVETSICARNFEIEVDTRATPEAAGAAAALNRRLREALGAHVFAEDERPLAALALDALRARGWTLGTAESCTGGMVAAEVTAVPGSSAAFVGAEITYSNGLKRSRLGVPAEVIERHGAVSPEAAAAMAHGARRVLGCDVAVSVTGVAGPDGGTREKPVGLVFLHLASPAGEEARRVQWPGDRGDVRRRATVAALHLVRTHLSTLS